MKIFRLFFVLIFLCSFERSSYAYELLDKGKFYDGLSSFAINTRQALASSANYIDNTIGSSKSGQALAAVSFLSIGLMTDPSNTFGYIAQSVSLGLGIKYMSELIYKPTNNLYTKEMMNNSAVMKVCYPVTEMAFCTTSSCLYLNELISHTAYSQDAYIVMQYLLFKMTIESITLVLNLDRVFDYFHNGKLNKRSAANKAICAMLLNTSSSCMAGLYPSTESIMHLVELYSIYELFCAGTQYTNQSILYVEQKTKGSYAQNIAIDLKNALSNKDKRLTDIPGISRTTYLNSRERSMLTNFLNIFSDKLVCRADLDFLEMQMRSYAESAESKKFNPHSLMQIATDENARIEDNFEIISFIFINTFSLENSLDNITDDNKKPWRLLELLYSGLFKS
jgi:hypothetical protein